MGQTENGLKIDHGVPEICYSRAQKKMFGASRIKIGPLVAELCSAEVGIPGKIWQKSTKLILRVPIGHSVEYRAFW